MRLKGLHIEQAKDAISGLRIRNLNRFFIVAMLVFTMTLVVSTSLLSDRYMELIQTTDEYHQIEINARMVQSASEDLTRDAQMFVMTGEKSYMDSYFYEAEVSKRRENAINNLEEIQATETLIHKLKDSVTESMNLMLLEYEAMRYASEGYHLDLTSLPSQVQETVLPEEAKGMSDEEKIQRAQQIMFGKEYEGYKQRIFAHEGEYLEEAIVLMDQLQQNERREMERHILLQRVVILLIIAISLVLFFAIARMVVYPLDNAVNRISGGEMIFPIDGTYEIQYMSHTYNGFHQDSIEVQKRLKLEAERDELTGVLNRRGYQMVIERLQSENYPIALLVMDVDRFKEVNDNYGHEMGDLALKKVARKLMESFRGTDITSRIGGDEFTVIMSEVTEMNKDIIWNKIDELNRYLQKGDADGCPPLSLSVGCAFSRTGYNQCLFTVADAKMYEAKNAGGGSMRFA